MRKIRFTEHQMIAVLKSFEAGRTVKDVCREAAIPKAAITTGRRNMAVWKPADIKKVKDLEDENRRLKQMFAVLSLECRALKDFIEKSLKTSYADTRLNTLKLDSLDYVELMVLAKREFDITLNARMFIDHPDMSLMDMCGLLNAQRVSPDA